MKKYCVLLLAAAMFAACEPEKNDKGEKEKNGTASARYDAPELVDLGLPSGVKWAASDLGSTDPMVPGDYFSWGETEPSTTFSDSNKYIEYSGGHQYATKYSVSMRGGKVLDMKTVLEAEDDAATVGIGKGWRTPTYDDFMELLDNCEWRQQYTGEYPNEVGVIVATSLINGKTLTFLNKGHFSGREFLSRSMYMSSSMVCSAERACANNSIYVLYGTDLQGSGYRTCGMNVRPVYGGTASPFAWKVNADGNPTVSSTTATFGGTFNFAEEAGWTYRYYARLFDGVLGDTWCAQKDFTSRSAKVSFDGLTPNHTYYYVVCYEATKREGSYSYWQGGGSEVRSFTTAN